MAGTGKSTLAQRVAQELHTPLLAFDHFIDEALPRHLITDPGNWSNNDVFNLMFSLAELHLSLGISAILDAVFFGDGRDTARAIATRQQARFCPIYTYCSDETIWRQRVLYRFQAAQPQETPAEWEAIIASQAQFRPWDPAAALFIDAIHPVEDNLTRVLAHLQADGAAQM